jgi:hypothetical protein
LGGTSNVNAETEKESAKALDRRKMWPIPERKENAAFAGRPERVFWARNSEIHDTHSELNRDIYPEAKGSQNCFGTVDSP